MSKIIWTKRGNTHYGHVPAAGRTITLFSINWGIQRGERWILRSELPGFKTERHFVTVEEAQADADHILAFFAEVISK
jgi:hypothetical protein